MKNNIQKQKDIAGITGQYRFIKRHSLTKSGNKAYGRGRVISESEWIHNLVMASTNRGLNIIARNLIEDYTYSLGITRAKIGTSTTAVNESQTDLVAPVAYLIPRGNQATATKSATMQFFIPDANLTNGTYNEFGIFCGPDVDLRMFARSIISPAYSKSSLEDTTIEYVINLTN